MSRSRRKQPITGITCSESDKWWKRLATKRLRQRVHSLLHSGLYDLAEYLTSREITCSFTSPKDGKQWVDEEKHPEVMRK